MDRPLWGSHTGRAALVICCHATVIAAGLRRKPKGRVDEICIKCHIVINPLVAADLPMPQLPCKKLCVDKYDECLERDIYVFTFDTEGDRPRDNPRLQGEVGEERSVCAVAAGKVYTPTAPHSACAASHTAPLLHLCLKKAKVMHRRGERVYARQR